VVEGIPAGGSRGRRRHAVVFLIGIEHIASGLPPYRVASQGLRAIGLSLSDQNANITENYGEYCHGHGHNGMTSAPVTGRIIADLVAGRMPIIDSRPYRPGRF
jgi:hypothetical protein